MKGVKHKEKQSFLQMCFHVCSSKGDGFQSLLLSKKLVYTILSNNSKKNKIAYKKLLDKLPNNSSDIEKQLDEIYHQLKTHYLPIILDIKKNKSILN